MNYVLLVILIAVGIYDIYLTAKKHPTLSQQYQALLPTWADMVVFGAALYILLAELSWVDWRLKVIMAAIAGHIFWPNKERYDG